MYRLLVRDAAGETERALLNEIVPTWVVDIVVDKNLPKFIKIPFHLSPHPSSGFKNFKKLVIIYKVYLYTQYFLSRIIL